MSLTVPEGALILHLNDLLVQDEDILHRIIAL